MVHFSESKERLALLYDLLGVVLISLAELLVSLDLVDFSSVLVSYCYHLHFLYWMIFDCLDDF